MVIDVIVQLAIGIAAGILSGMFGIGGGVVLVPALILINNFSQIQANGTSLAALMAPVGIFAVIAYWKKGLVDIKVAILLDFGLLFGVYFGSTLALSLPNVLLKQLYGAFLFLVSLRTFEFKKEFFQKFISRNIRKRSINADINVFQAEERNISSFWILTGGLLTGILSGMFGIGGGLVMVPIMITFMEFPQKKAVGTSLAALLLPTALPGVIQYYNAGHLEITTAIHLALGLVAGAIIGAKITLSTPTPILKRIFSIFILILALNFIISAFFR